MQQGALEMTVWMQFCVGGETRRRSGGSGLNTHLETPGNPEEPRHGGFERSGSFRMIHLYQFTHNLSPLFSLKHRLGFRV
jgi:hypothetical protein